MYLTLFLYWVVPLVAASVAASPLMVEDWRYKLGGAVALITVLCLIQPWHKLVDHLMVGRDDDHPG
jgi:hypothetical protein